MCSFNSKRYRRLILGAALVAQYLVNVDPLDLRYCDHRGYRNASNRSLTQRVLLKLKHVHAFQ